MTHAEVLKKLEGIMLHYKLSESPESRAALLTAFEEGYDIGWNEGGAEAERDAYEAGEEAGYHAGWNERCKSSSLLCR